MVVIEQIQLWRRKNKDNLKNSNHIYFIFHFRFEVENDIYELDTRQKKPMKSDICGQP